MHRLRCHSNFCFRVAPHGPVPEIQFRPVTSPSSIISLFLDTLNHTVATTPRIAVDRSILARLERSPSCHNLRPPPTHPSAPPPSSPPKPDCEANPSPPIPRRPSRKRKYGRGRATRKIGTRGCFSGGCWIGGWSGIMGTSRVPRLSRWVWDLLVFAHRTGSHGLWALEEFQGARRAVS